MTRRDGLDRALWAAAVSAATVLALFLLQGRVGFSLWDEGYLWYGAQRVLAGEVPLRDFESYDPGRYYWAAALMSLAGTDSIVALRAAAALFQILGLTMALAALDHHSDSSGMRQRLFWLLAAVTIVAWMAPPHRLFDGSLALMLIATLSYLVAHPSARRFFLTGLIVGLAAVFGRNHGVYGAVGSLCIIGYLAFGHRQSFRLVRSLGIWAAGVVVGFLPVLLAVAFVSDFAPIFWEGIHYQFEIVATNLALPVPWPWRAPANSETALWQHLLIGTFFIALLAYALVGLAHLLRPRSRQAASPVLLASASLSLPYAHYAYSRADLEHLALGIFPLLLGAFAMLSGQKATIRWSAGVLLCAASALTMLPLHSGWTCRPSRDCLDANVGGDVLRVDRGTAGHLWLLERLIEDYAPGDRTFLAAPFWPGAYAAFHRRSPLWDSYPLFATSEAKELAEVERIRSADPGFVVIYDASLDRREDLNFEHTHPVIDRYIRDHFEPVSGYTDNPRYRIYRNAAAATP